MTKTVRDIVERAVAAGVGIDTAFDTQATLNEKFGNAADQAIKELEAIMLEVIGGQPSKMNSDNWKIDRRVVRVKEQQRQALHEALYGKDEK